MKAKIFVLILIIFISLLSLVTSFNEENHNNYQNENGNENDFSKESNPYLVFGVPPWTKFKDIKKKYSKIKEKMKQKNQIHSMEFKRYKMAYEQIKKIYKDNDEKDKTFLDVLITTIKHIFWYEFIIFAGLFLSWAIYTFNTFAALLVGTFICIDNLIPHWFSNSMYEYIFSFILTLIIYFRNYLFCGKKKNDENDNNNETNVDKNGKRKRKRFSKIE
jgi:ABC-type sugar transport system permease subunit